MERERTRWLIGLLGGARFFFPGGAGEQSQSSNDELLLLLLLLEEVIVVGMSSVLVLKINIFAACLGEYYRRLEPTENISTPGCGGAGWGNPASSTLGVRREQMTRSRHHGAHVTELHCR